MAHDLLHHIAGASRQSGPDGVTNLRKCWTRHAAWRGAGGRPALGLLAQVPLPAPRRIRTVIRQLRKSKKLTQQELARRARVSQPYFSQLEAGVPHGNFQEPLPDDPQAPREGPGRAGDGAAGVGGSSMADPIWRMRMTQCAPLNSA